MNAATMTAQLRNLYETTHISTLKEDEFTIGMFAKSNNCNTGTAGRLVEKAIEQGLVEYVGDRLHMKKRAQAYRFKKPS